MGCVGGPVPAGVIDATVHLLESYYRQPGRAYGLEPSIGHAIRCLKRTYYDDRPQMRARRNVILQGPRGSCKSTISKYALTQIYGCVDVLDPVHAPEISARTLPTVCIIGSGSGFERARGTFGSDGSLLSPLFQESTWIYAPELMTVLGHNKSERAKRIDDFNSIIEEGSVRITLAKAGNMDLDKRREMAERIPQNAGFHYDPERAVVTYECTAAFLGCTRELPLELRAELNQNGYWSRHSIGEWSPVSSEARSHADKKFGPPPAPPVLAELRGRWVDLWNTEFARVNAPPEDMMDDAVVWYNGKLQDIEDESETPFRDLYSGRDDADIAQLVTAATLNRLTRNRPPGARSLVEEIPYAQDDLQTAKLWMQPRLAHLRNLHETATEEEAAENDRAFTMLAGFIKALAGKGDSELDYFTSKDLVAHFVKGGGGASTARRHLCKLRKAGIVSTVRNSPGDYHVDAGALLRMGYSVPEAEEASHEFEERRGKEDYLEI